MDKLGEELAGASDKLRREVLADLMARKHRETLDNLEMTAGGRTAATWRCQAELGLDAILADGFFDRCRSHGLRRLDRISVTCDPGDGAIECGELVVTEAHQQAQPDGIWIRTACLWRQAVARPAAAEVLAEDAA